MDLEKEVEIIKQRNAKVEADKAWEISVFRKISILTITYILACLVMYVIGVTDFWLNALIPTLGFFLSTLSFGGLKQFWIKNCYSRVNDSQCEK
jgi:hypothetical protein